MAEGVPDKTTAEQILDTLAVPGSTSREFMIQAMKAYRGDDFNADQILDNLAKREFTTPDEFLTELEKTTGIDKTFASTALGAGAGAVIGASAGPVGAFIGAVAGGTFGGTTEFGADLMTDIATDPIGFLFKPASVIAKSEKASRLARKSVVAQNKLAKGVKLAVEEDKLLKAGAKDALRLAVKSFAGSPEDFGRAATGATLGLMAIDPEEEDWIASSAKRVAGLTLAGPIATKAVKGTAEFANRNMTEFIDAYHIKKHKDLFAKIKEQIGDDAFEKLPPSEASKIARSASRSKEFKEAMSFFLEEEGKVMSAAGEAFDKQAISMVKAGELSQDGAKNFVTERLKEFQRERGRMFSRQVEAREGIFEDMVRKNSEKIIDSHIEKQMSRTGKIAPFPIKLGDGPRDIANITGKDVHKRLPNGEFAIPFDSLKSLFKKDTLHNILNEATAEANAFSFGNLINISKTDPSMANALKQIPNMNRKMVNLYNEAWGAKSKDFIPTTGFSFWAYDINRANKFADTFRNSTEGFVKRANADVITFVEDIPKGPEEFLKYKQAIDHNAASTYAGMFLGQQERNARKIVAQMFNAREQTASLRKMYQNLNDYREGTIEFGDMLNKNGEISMNIYDKWLNLIKSTHLMLNATWTKNNMMENTINAYLQGGAKTAVEAFADPIIGQSMRVLSKLDQKMGTKIIERLGKNNSFNKIAEASIAMAKDSNNVGKVIDFSDEWLNMARDYGVVSATKFTDFKRLAGNDADFLQFLVGEEGAERIAKQLIEEGTISKKVDKVSNALWNLPWGKYNDFSENTMRFVSWRENAKAIAHEKYGADVAKVLENGGEPLKRASRGVPKNSMEEKVQASLKEASQRTEDIFFNYDNVTEFERQVMKRVFPYWTFWSRNFDKFTNLMFDPKMAPRIAKSAKVLTSQGDQVAPEDKGAIPDFFRQRGVRGRETDLGLELISAPGLALLEYAGNLTAKEDTLSRMSPILKAFPIIGAEGLLNMDFLTKRPLMPTEKNPRVRIFENAITGIMPDSALESMGVFRNEFGNLYTNNRGVARALHLQKNLAPFITLGGISDELARASRNIDVRDSTKAKELIEFASPFQHTTIPPSMASRQFKKTQRNVEVFRSTDPSVVLQGKREAVNPDHRDARNARRKLKRRINKELRSRKQERAKQIRRANKLRRKQMLDFRKRMKKLRGNE